VNITIRILLFVLAFMVGVVLTILRHVWFAAGDTLLFDLALVVFAAAVLVIWRG
jgi:hypothetical protein